MPRFLVILLVVGLVLVGRIAHAQSDPGVVVVDVAADSQEIDATQMRTAIGQELGCDAVSPDDARASTARGRIDVSIDRAASQLVVSYRAAGATPIVRGIDLPADPEAIARAAVLLAGNLARDEAADLVAQLRKPEPVPSAPARDDELEKSERLRHLLADYAAKDRRVRLVTSWSALGAGLAASSAGFYLSLRGDPAVGRPLFPVGLAFTFAGVFSLLVESPFEQLSNYYEDHVTTNSLLSTWVREEAERRWKRAADKAAAARVPGSIIVISLSVITTTLQAGMWASSPRSTETDIEAATNVAAGLGGIVYGVVMLTSEPDVESRLHEYERGLGHPIQLQDVSLRVIPVSGGLAAGLGGQF
jgi:hypothetical protein